MCIIEIRDIFILLRGGRNTVSTRLYINIEDIYVFADN